MSNQCAFQGLSKQFAYVVEQLQSGGHRIELRALSLPQCQAPAEESGPPDAVKEFFLADTTLSMERLVSHMQSLTDAQCAEFFKAEGSARPKKEKAAKTTSASVGEQWEAASFAKVSLQWASSVNAERYAAVELLDKHGVSYLAVPCGQVNGQPEGGAESYLLTELSSKQVQKLCSGEWPVSTAVRQGKRWLLVHGYSSNGFHALPTARVQREWLARWSS